MLITLTPSPAQAETMHKHSHSECECEWERALIANEPNLLCVAERKEGGEITLVDQLS